MAEIPHATPAGTQSPKTVTGLTNSTHSSSSSSAERFHLDEFDDSPVLVYRYRGGGLHTSSQKELCALLDKGEFSATDNTSQTISLTIATEERLRVTKKPISRGDSYIDVAQNDLYLPEEHAQYRTFPSYYQSLASIRVPTKVYLSRMLLGSYDKLYIVSPQSSPESSVGDPNSRSNTWGKDSQEDARD